MSKMKKVIAIALAATMAMGSTLMVSATELGSGGTTGKGENEGHVDKELINVVLPTVPTGDGSPFEYITDPERLIQETNGARYEDYTFPDPTSDTGVYFRKGENEFANTSETLKVINKSSCDMAITLSAKAVASAGDKDLVLAEDENVDGTKPLYLALKVGTTTTQAISATATPVTKTISGTLANFETKYTGSAYEFVTREDASQWKALEFSLTGKVHNGTVAADTTAPTIEVTWAFDKGTASADTADEVDHVESGDPGIISISDYVKADPQKVIIKFSAGKGSGAIDIDGAKLLVGANKTAVDTSRYTVSIANKTVTINGDAPFLATATADVSAVIALTKEGKTVKELSGVIKVKNDYSSAEIISITDFVKSSPSSVVITFSLGDGPKAVDADGATLYVDIGSGKTAANTAKYTVNMADKTITIMGDTPFLTSVSADVPVVVALTKGGSEVRELTGTIKIK